MPHLLRRAALGLLVLGLALTLTINGLVAWISAPGPWPLDPRHLPAKALALLLYARHRAGCALFDDDGDVLGRARSAARLHHLEPELFEALVRTESSALAHRISPTGAMGPAQLTFATAQTLNVSDPFAPGEATDAGARYLQQLLARFHGQRTLAIAAYNAGPGAIVDGVPHNGETELYVPRVLGLTAQLQRRSGARPASAPARLQEPSSTSTPEYISSRGPASSKEEVIPRSGTPGSARVMACRSASGSRCSRAPRPPQLK